MGIFDSARNLLGKVFGPPPEPLTPTRPRLAQAAPVEGAREAQPAKPQREAPNQPARSSGEMSGQPDPTRQDRQMDPTIASMPSILTQSSDRILARVSQDNISLQRASSFDHSWREWWIAEIVRRLSAQQDLEPEIKLDLPAEQVRKTTHLMVVTVFELLEKLAGHFNQHIDFAPNRITATEAIEVKETAAPDSTSAGAEPKEARIYSRCRAASSSWALSVRGREGLVEFFLLPVSEVMRLSQAETYARLKLTLSLGQRGNEHCWLLEGYPVDAPELRVLVRNLFRELALASQASKAAADFPAESIALPRDLGGDKLQRAVHQLVMERQNLVQKIITQQEEIQNTIARELHDTVIADVMMLKRSLAGDKGLSDAEVIKVLDQITSHLREICHDLSPRDLKDWGLQTVIEDLLQRVGERTGADCALSADTDLPDLPNAVQLHIYRIVQECMNNIEKYAQASRVQVRMYVEDDTLYLTIEDDGKGFEVAETGGRRDREGGRGMGSIRERAELIRCFYPAELLLESEPNKGTKTTLKVKLSGAFGKA